MCKVLKRKENNKREILQADWDKRCGGMASPKLTMQESVGGLK